MWCLSAISQRVRWLNTRVESINLTIWVVIVRNNYYQITINDITQPGEPITDPTVDPPTDKDDETNYWINVSIKVLSWKIRTQNVIL